MHEKAAEWDKAHGVDTRWPNGGKYPKNKPLPENRPCDWCGEPVDKGFIHDECAKKEEELWLDLLY